LCADDETSHGRLYLTSLRLLWIRDLAEGAGTAYALGGLIGFLAHRAVNNGSLNRMILNVKLQNIQSIRMGAGRGLAIASRSGALSTVIVRKRDEWAAAIQQAASSLL